MTARTIRITVEITLPAETAADVQAVFAAVADQIASSGRWPTDDVMQMDPAVDNPVSEPLWGPEGEEMGRWSAQAFPAGEEA